MAALTVVSKTGDTPMNATVASSFALWDLEG